MPLQFLAPIHTAHILEASRRFSTRVLVDLLDVTGVWVAGMVGHLPPDGPAVFGVAWAEALAAPVLGARSVMV
jgi:hypothetical protein